VKRFLRFLATIAKNKRDFLPHPRDLGRCRKS
jgi:hypothetical protein